MKRWVLALGLVGQGGCRIDPIERLTTDDDFEAPPPQIEIVPDGAVYTPEVVKLEAQLRRHLGVLAGPYFGGRRPGTDGATQTVSYLLTTGTDAGLRPAAPDGGWFQSVPLQIGTTTGTAAVVEGQALSLETGIAFSQGLVEGDFAKTARLVDGGFGITASEWGIDDYANLTAKDAVVLVRDGVPEGRPAGTIFGTRAHKLERARQAGAVAVLLAPGVPSSDPTWSQMVQELTRPRVRVPGPSDTKPPLAHAIVAADLETQLRAALAQDPLQIHLELRTEVREVRDPNIIGRFVGEVHPEQSVIIVAHWDAGGLRVPLDAGGGSEDNASGVAVALALASRFGEWLASGSRPVRSVVFAFTASDSLQTHGTRRFATAGIPSPENVSAAIVLDGFDLDEPNARLVAYGAMDSALDPVLQRVFEDRLHREPAGSVHDSPARARLAEIGITAVAFSRRSPDSPLGDAPFDSTTDLHAVAEETDALFDLLWQLATEP